MRTAFLALGSNLGDRENYLKKAVRIIENHNYIIIIKKSTILETKALDFTDQPDFLNRVLKIQTGLSPQELLDFCKKSETEIGRTPSEIPKGPREIDIDILDYSNLVINTDNLTLPHPALRTRPFIRTILESMGEWESIKSE